MANEDVTFTFDLKVFKNAMNNVGKMFGGFESMAGKIVNGVGSKLNGMIAKIGLIGLAWKGVQAILNAMPEVGQAFDIAKGIFLNNFVWPLRQAVMPLLQKLLDWVRDNRGQFVKWGQTVVTIFKIAIDIVGRFFKIVTDLAKKIGGALGNVFNVFGRNIDETINLILFKVASVMIFISQLIEPIVKVVGDVLAKIIEFVGEVGKGFLSGIFKDFGSIGDNVKSIWKSISEILDKLFFSDEAKKRWGEVFKFIGEVIGKAFKIVTDILDTLLKMIKNVIEFAQNPTLENFVKIFTSDTQYAAGNTHGDVELMKKQDKEAAERYEKEQESKKMYEQNLKNAIIPANQVLSVTGGFNQNNNIYLNVTEGDATQAGKNFAQGIDLRNKVINSQLKGGY